MTTALKYSVNVTAVGLLNDIGVETGWDFAVKCGLPLIEEDKGLALALGGITYGVSPLNLATAYSCFANGGYYIEPTTITKITDRDGNIIYEHSVEKTRVMSAETAYIMNTMLKETINSGTGRKGYIGRPAAGKTGTTQLPDAFGNRKGNKDSWWAGYTPDLVGIVWMGFDKDYSDDGSPQYMVNVYGGQYPVVIWKQVMRAALEDVPASDFEKPADSVSKSIKLIPLRKKRNRKMRNQRNLKILQDPTDPTDPTRSTDPTDPTDPTGRQIYGSDRSYGSNGPDGPEDPEDPEDPETTETSMRLLFIP